jgi:hypothetical protein
VSETELAASHKWLFSTQLCVNTPSGVWGAAAYENGVRELGRKL